MQKKILIFALVLMGATQAQAVEPKEKGFYAGGVVGFTNFEDDGLGKIYSQDLTSESGAFGVFGGYKLLKYLAFEGRFTYLGDAGESVRYKPTALTANVVGILPLGASGVELFGQLGLGGVFISENLSSVGADSEDKSTVGTAGVGVRIHATEMVSFSFQYDWYQWEQKDKGEKYDFNADSFLAGIQWLF